jgi:recombination protein RecT
MPGINSKNFVNKINFKMETHLVKEERNPIKSLFGRDDVKQKFQELLGKRATSFITSVLQIAAQNQLLAKADPVSIYQAAAVAATLDLPLNQNLGFAYIVPYNQSYKDDQGRWQKKRVAQFQMGYKGFIQLAQRSGQFKSIYAAPIYEGQIISEDPLNGYEFDFTKKSETLVGYAARFKLLNGFEATWYMTIDQLKKHGAKYSKTFTNEKGLWNTDFDTMSQKTVIKLLLSKFAPLSVDIQRAVVTDQAVINDADTQDVTYIDHDAVTVDKEAERVTLMIDDCKSVDELLKIQPHVGEEQMPLFNQKYQELAS